MTRTRRIRKEKIAPLSAPLPPPEPPVRPQLPPHAFTVSQWKKNPVLQHELQIILDQPVLRMAFQTLMLAALPGAMPVTELVPGVSAEAMALADSNRYHHRSGMSFLHRALQGLARSKNVVETQAPWGRLLPESE